MDFLSVSKHSVFENSSEVQELTSLHAQRSLGLAFACCPRAPRRCSNLILSLLEKGAKWLLSQCETTEFNLYEKLPGRMRSARSGGEVAEVRMAGRAGFPVCLAGMYRRPQDVG